MLHDPARHERLLPIAWDEARVRAAIAAIVDDTERRYAAGTGWPVHPHDIGRADDAVRVATPLYFGITGVLWALQYLREVGAVAPGPGLAVDFDRLLQRQRAWLREEGRADDGAYLMGETPILMLAHRQHPGIELEDRLAARIEGLIEHPSRELMWGAPGGLLAASFLHERTGQDRWAVLFRRTAARLWAQLEESPQGSPQGSPEPGCRCWTQDLYGRRSRYLGAAHGFAGVAAALIRGRHLLEHGAWADWARCIVETMTRTATWEGDQASWREELPAPGATRWKKLMQICHGAPGVVVCLGELPETTIEPLLLAAGRAVWAAGPIAKGSNLCHGTGGNGYAFLKLYRRTQDPLWLQRARAFAMHGLAQTEAEAAHHGRLRYSLWTGDPGFAVFLWDCLQGQARFPTLDVFDAARPRA